MDKPKRGRAAVESAPARHWRSADVEADPTGALAETQRRMHLVIRGMSTVGVDEMPGDIVTAMAMMATGIAWMKRLKADKTAVMKAVDVLYPLVQYAAINE
jgi:hypothetical protein